MIRVIIAGSRDFNSPGIFNNAMTELLSDIPDDQLEIVSGGCRGADAMGEQYAKDLNIKCTVFPAEWDKYGKAAGPIRNEQMAKYASEADRGILIAFPIGESRGTRNMIRLAQQYRLEVEIIEQENICGIQKKMLVNIALIVNIFQMIIGTARVTQNLVLSFRRR